MFFRKKVSICAILSYFCAISFGVAADTTVTSKQYVDNQINTRAAATNKVNGAPLSNENSVFYGTSSTAAATTQKAVSIPAITTLGVGTVIVVQPTNTSTVANSTIKLNDFAAYPMRYNNAAITTSTDSIVWNSAYPSVFVFDGTYWRFLSHGVDSNTTYSAMSVAEGQTGTATSSRVVRADYLKQIIQYWANQEDTSDLHLPAPTAVGNMLHVESVNDVLTWKEFTPDYITSSMLNDYLTTTVAANTYQTKITSDNKLLSDLVDDTNQTHKFVTASEKSTWNAKQNAISDLATIRSGASAGATAVQFGDLADVATSGSYNDLTDKPTIPSAPGDIGAQPVGNYVTVAQGNTNANKAVITNASGNVTTGTIATGMIAANAVTSAKISDGTIVNADISSSAAIAQSKISGLTDALDAKMTTPTATATGQLLKATVSNGTTTWSAFTPSYASSSHNHPTSDVNLLTGYSKPNSTSALATTDTLNAALGKLEKALDGKASSSHTHTSNQVTALTSYSKGTSAAALATTDTLNAALGKLENKADNAATTASGKWTKPSGSNKQMLQHNGTDWAVVTPDTTPTQNSTKPVESGGVYTALAGKASSSHNHDTVYQKKATADYKVSKSDGTWNDLGTTLDTAANGYNADNAVTAGTIASALAGKQPQTSGSTDYQLGTAAHGWVDMSTAQRNALNSGITSSKVSTYDGYATGKQDKITSISTSGTGNVVTAVTASNGTITATKGNVSYNDLTDTPTIPTDTNTTYTFAEGSTDGAFSVTPSGGSAQSVPVHGWANKQDKITSISTSGSGSVVTAVTASNGTITATKGDVAWSSITGAPSIPTTPGDIGAQPAGDYVNKTESGTANQNKLMVRNGSGTEISGTSSDISLATANGVTTVTVTHATSADTATSAGTANSVAWANVTDKQTADANNLGIGKLYTSTGTATDGSMTQNAITDELNSKLPKNSADVQFVSEHEVDALAGLLTQGTDVKGNLKSLGMQIATNTSNITGLSGNKVNGALLSNANSVFYGTSSTAAGTAQKEVSISSITTLDTGTVIVVKPTLTSTAANGTIKLNDFAAKAMRYNNAAITTANAGLVWKANTASTWVYDGTYWQYVGPVYTASTGVSISNGAISNSGVRSVTASSSGSNGSLAVNTNGTTTYPVVKGWDTKVDIAQGAAKTNMALYTDSSGNVTPDSVKVPITDSNATGGWSYMWID
ncbi:MAG: hypothetical protein K6B71_01880 [Alphaproteobacteria bacterium]|nr:hypothetical protein [Alphaproteobacteria bacterium]